MSDPTTPRTPTPGNRGPNVDTPETQTATFVRSQSRRALFEADDSLEHYPANSNHEDDPPPLGGNLESGGQASNSAWLDTLLLQARDIRHSAGEDNFILNHMLGFSATPPPPDLSKYRRIAEQAGLRGEQADAAVAIATMTPRTARVQLFSTVTHGINLLNKFREAQQKNWEMPTKVKDRMRAVVRLAVLAPIPSCYKDQLPLLVLRILIKDGTLAKDYEAKWEKRAKVIMKEISTYAGHFRSDVKTLVINAMNMPYHDLLKLTKAVCKPCGKDIHITKEVLGAVAYLRAIMALQAEGRTAVAISADRDVWWDLLEHRVKDTRSRHSSLDARERHLQQWVEEDQTTYGRCQPDELATLATRSTTLQAAVFDAQFKGVEALETDILLAA